MTNMALPTLSIAALQEGYSRGAFSPVDVVESLLACIANVAPCVNAFTTLAAEQARAEARQCEDDLTRGQRRGPLHGIPFAVKNLYDSAPLRTTYGSPITGELQRHWPQLPAQARTPRAEGTAPCDGGGLSE
jgi:aspartyl-tRNA(Asn)/glutamyl-tRNA(Gln) amidotransferase subunit A